MPTTSTAVVSATVPKPTAFLVVGIRVVTRLLWALLLLDAATCVVVSVGAVAHQLQVRSELSGSMSPAIDVGDLLVYRPSPAEQLRVGQVVSFVEPGQPLPVTHRLTTVTVTGGRVTVVTGGDANNAVDAVPQVFSSGQTVWRVVAVVPGAGPYANGLIGARGALFMLGFVPLLLALPWMEREVAGLPRRP